MLTVMPFEDFLAEFNIKPEDEFEMVPNTNWFKVPQAGGFVTPIDGLDDEHKLNRTYAVVTSDRDHIMPKVNAKYAFVDGELILRSIAEDLQASNVEPAAEE